MIKAGRLWLYHIIPALPLSTLTTLPLFKPSFHLRAAFKTCQLTFQLAGRTSWCLCGGLLSGLCVALSADGHTGSWLCLPAHLCHSQLASPRCRLMFMHFAFFVRRQAPVEHWLRLRARFVKLLHKSNESFAVI